MAFIVFTKIISKLKRVRKKEKNSPNPRHTFCNNLNLFYPHNSFLKCVLLSRDTSRILDSDYTLTLCWYWLHYSHILVLDYTLILYWLDFYYCPVFSISIHTVYDLNRVYRTEKSLQKLIQDSFQSLVGLKFSPTSKLNFI